ncbi:hypothetical protein OIO90_005935 [Microbotryomycetes sp. JL221]|nr:hypothetical protein OIO90_005935 [Microbotryomycetes sp. JL221]
MGLFNFGDDSQQAQAYQQVQQGEHKSSWSHELIAGAAAFEAARAYEKHVAQNGPPPNHQMAKELLAGFAGAEADKLFETHGLDFIDRERAQYAAKEQAMQAVSQNNYY